jgi:hypothetical protein
MIRLQRTMQLRRGYQAVKWARELTDYVNTTYQKPQFTVFRARFGNLSTVCWVGDFDDLPTLAEWQQKVGADRSYRELVKKSFAFVIPGTVEDTILESV